MNFEKGTTQIISKEKKIVVYTEPGSTDINKILKDWFKRLPEYEVIFINIKNKNL